jgi:hypothetical protein
MFGAAVAFIPTYITIVPHPAPLLLFLLLVAVFYGMEMVFVGFVMIVVMLGRIYEWIGD